MLEGMTAGFILSLSLFSGSVWLAKAGVVGRPRQVCTIGLAFVLSQALWFLMGASGLLLMMVQLPFIQKEMHWLAATALFFLSIQFFKAPRAECLDDVVELPDALTLFRDAFNRSMALPVSLPLGMAILMATGAYVNHEADWARLPYVLAGSVFGLIGWWGMLSFLAVFFVRRVPLPVTLRSLNKIPPFCGILYLCLAVIALFFSTC